VAGSLSFDDAEIAKLKLAAEEVAWLTGRGYPLGVVGELVASHHSLGPVHRAALARGTCSEPQYRRRAARELESEDVARRPLAIDAIDAMASIEAAIAGTPLLMTLDGTVRALELERARYSLGPGADEAIERIVTAAKDLRPSVVKWVIDAASPAAKELESRFQARASAVKLKVEAVQAAAVPKALAKERQVVTGDADVLDACAGWHNLIGRAVEGIASAKIVRLQ